MESKTTQLKDFFNNFSGKFYSKRIGNFVTLFLTIWLALAMSFNTWAQATISTDKADYAPGETVQIAGSGFLPGEYVSLLIIHIDPNFIYHIHADMEDALVDANGDFSSTWFVLDEELNTTLFLTAVGLTSDLYAETMFTDSGTFSWSPGDGTQLLNIDAGNSASLTDIILTVPKNNGIQTPSI
jgi:hypothetical protein